jgi:hypothetical protein
MYSIIVAESVLVVRKVAKQTYPINEIVQV